MKKIIKEYMSDYGEILSNDFERYDEILKQTSKKSLNKKPLTDLILKISNIEWNRYHFIVYLLPKATPRPRCSKGSFVFYVKGAKDNKDIFSKFILSKNLNIPKDEISSYWDKENEIDIYANYDGFVIVAEAKYKERKICKNILNLLIQKCEKSKINWDKIALFSKSGFSNELLGLKDNRVILFELDDFKDLYE